MSHDLHGDVLSVTLHDAALHDELELLVEMVVAATGSSAPLAPDQIDQVLFAPRIVRQRTGTAR